MAPSSLELLSYPLPSYLGQAASQQQLGGGGASREEAAQRARAQRRQLYGVRLRVAGSGWTPALALDAPELGAASAQGQPQQARRLVEPPPSAAALPCRDRTLAARRHQPAGVAGLLLRTPPTLKPCSLWSPLSIFWCPQEEDLQAARPVLIRALSRDSGLVHEVVARLEVTAFGTSQVTPGGGGLRWAWRAAVLGVEGE